MTKRTVFHVVYDRERKFWVAKVGGMIADFSRSKYALIGKAPKRGSKNTPYGLRFLCYRMWWQCRRIPSQIIVHTRDGKIAKEYTYGNDPKRSRG